MKITRLFSAAVIMVAALAFTSCNNKKFHINGNITDAKDSMLYLENISLKNSAKLTREDLKIAPESPTMKLSEPPAVEPSDQTSKTVRHAPLVYRVEEIAQLLAISNRAAYNLCNTTKDFKVIRLGTSIRVSKQSFDDWFAAV